MGASSYPVTVQAGQIIVRSTLHADVQTGRGAEPTTWSGVLTDLPARLINAALASGWAEIFFEDHDMDEDRVIRRLRADGSDLHFIGDGLPPSVIW